MPEIYVIGDVQGCHESLRALVDKLSLGNKDRLWFCGDLVNRGPASAKVLRWVMKQGPRAQVVLGNHDLHLLAAAAGQRKLKQRDTFQDVLEAEDRKDLLRWLRKQPLAHHEKGVLMVHAGVHPQWSLKQTLTLAEKCSAAVQDQSWLDAWKLSRPTPPTWSAELQGNARIAAALSILVGMRTLYRDGRLENDYTGHPDNRPKGTDAWFTRGHCDATIVFGHWAALGLHLGKTRIGIDTGCVWGGKLTAIRLSDRKVFQQASLERVQS